MRGSQGECQGEKDEPLTMRSISSLERRPLSLVMVICDFRTVSRKLKEREEQREERTLFDLPVVLSAAETFRIPLASMSKVTSIWGTPRGAGGIPLNSNLPKRLLSLVRARSPVGEGRD